MAKAISIKKRQIVFNKYDKKCAYCGCSLVANNWHVDHLTPLYRGWSSSDVEKYGLIKGTNNIDNLKPSCPTCNISKSTFTLETWRMQLKTKIDRLRGNVTNFRIVEKFKLITVNNINVIFYFETLKKNKH